MYLVKIVTMSLSKGLEQNKHWQRTISKSVDANLPNAASPKPRYPTPSPRRPAPGYNHHRVPTVEDEGHCDVNPNLIFWQRNDDAEAAKKLTKEIFKQSVEVMKAYSSRTVDAR